MTGSTSAPLTKLEMAQRVAQDIPRGAYVNLGIGLPTLVADVLPADADVTLHTENGMLGMGPAAKEGEIDPDLVNAGKIHVTELPGASYFAQADSFGMMRSGHIDVCVLGAFQVAANGDLANWSTGAPGAVPAVGGAMDLAVGARETVVMMTLLAKDGSPKIVKECTLPLTGLGCVSRVYTELGVFDVGPQGLHLVETHGITHDELEELLGMPLPLANQNPKPTKENIVEDSKGAL